MKAHSLLILLTLLLATSLGAFGQATSTPQIIEGTVRFSNTNPTIVSWLNGGRGMETGYIQARGEAPAPPLSSTASGLPATSGTVTPYEISVQSNPAGYPYRISPRITLGGRQVYWFAPQVSAPTTPTGGPVTLDFTECVSIIHVSFVDVNGLPTTVRNGEMIAYRSPDSTAGNPHAKRFEIADGSVSEILVVRGNETFTVDIVAEVGSSTYVDELRFTHRSTVETVCDDIIELTCVVPNAKELGRIQGNVDIIGEFEVTQDANDALNYADYTAIIADRGPFDNTRYDHVAGVNFSTPASGAYQLNNLLPSIADPTAGDYRVYADLLLRSGRQFNRFRTPALGHGSNPGVDVTGSTPVDLRNTFVIEPAYIRGNILLQGPEETATHPSMLRGLFRASDDDDDMDGIPDLAGTYKVYHSSVGAAGVDRIASGATHSAAWGFSRAVFDGSFAEPAQAFLGNYELTVGGLNSERSIWDPEQMNVVLGGGDVTNNNYYHNSYTIRDQRGNEYELDRGDTQNHNINYCMSEVLVRFRSDSDPFYDPQIRFSSGSFTGTDFQGNAADYDVNINLMGGAPRTLATATNVGYVRMLLPEGSYNFRPFIRSASTPDSRTELDAIALTIGGCERIVIEDCLQLDLDAPSCVNTQVVTIAGSVRTEEHCSNTVSQITYQLNDGPVQTVCTDCGTNPDFAFTLTLPDDQCHGNTLTVTATDNEGRVSSRTTTIRLDSVPPEIKCPEDILIECTDSDQTVVTYDVPTGYDNCSQTVPVVCTPPSGSVFPAGVTTVVCTATDTCGNTTDCSFEVDIRPPALTIRRAICVEWDCQGILQVADTITGPWTDIPAATSPYCVPADQEKRFYRVRR